MSFLVLALYGLSFLTQPIQNGHKNSAETKKSSQHSGCEVGSFPATSNTINETLAEPCKHADKADSQNKYQIIEHSTPLFNLLATIAIAVFTFFTVRIYRGQLKVMKINERAWIVPVVGTINPTNDPEQFQVQVDLRNNGKTPAWIIAAGSSGKGVTEQQPLPTVPRYSEMTPFSKKGTLLSPTGFLPQGFPLSKERLDHVQTRQSQLFIFGYAKYRDVYGDLHIVRYCYEARKSQDMNHPYPLEFYVGGPESYMEAD